MGEVVMKDGAKVPNTKKKMPGYLKFLIIFFIVILVLVGGTVGAIFICFYDNSHVDINNRENYANEKVFKEVLVDSLDNVVTSKKMEIKITQDQLNQVLFNAFKDNQQVNEIVKNVYVEANDAKYDFVFEIDAKGFFRTKLTLGASLLIEEETIKFKVDNVRVGRINGVQNLLGIITQFVTIPDLSQALKSSGLNMTIDVPTLTINYKLSDFYNDIINLMGSTNNDYSSIIYEIISNEQLRTIGATGNNVFEVNVNIDKLKLTSATTGIDANIKNGYFDDIFTVVKANTIALLNAGKILEADSDIVSRYMIGEEALLSASEVNKINEYKTNHVFDDYAASIPYYDGYTYDASNDLKIIAANQIAPQMVPIPFNHVEVEFDANALDKMFASSTSLGRINTFVRDKSLVDSTKDYKFNHVTIDRISMLVKNNHLFFVLSLNFNGEVGYVSLKSTKLDGEYGFGVMKLRIDDMYLGDMVVSANTKAAFLGIISSALGSGSFDDRFSIDGDMIVLNLKKTLDENGVLEALGYSTTFSLVDADNTSLGAIKIEADK